MKLSVSGMIPGNIFKSRKTSRSISKSETDQASFTSQSQASSPTSVLPLEDAWADVDVGVCFDLKHVFAMIDGDGDGKIGKDDLAAMLRRIGAEPLSADEMERVLNGLDADGDGCVSLEEFQSIGEAFAPPTCDGEMRRTFEFFDSNGDGRITAEELFKVFGMIGGSPRTLEDCRRMIRGVDKKGNGFVCFDDFTRMMELH